MPLMGLKNVAVLIPLTFLVLNGCSAKVSPSIVHARIMMDTIVEFSLWEKKPVSESGFNEVQRIEEKFSIFKEDSEISMINKGLVSKLSPECRYIIEESLRYNKITNGAFDITYRPDIKYDLGGIVKGYAADKVAQIFKDNKIERAMINVGGNLYLIGYPLGKNSWTIGIKDPINPDRLIGKLNLKSELGVSTSGNYERPGHIKDPRKRLKKDDILSVTIVAKTAMTADALSTGVFVLGKDEGMALIENLPDIEGVIMFQEDNEVVIKISSGLEGKFERISQR